MYLSRFRVLCVLLGICSAVWAHHSTAMFDQTRELSVQARVVKWQWGNPHCHFWLAQGGDVVMYELSPAPIRLAGMGWRADSLSPGEIVTVLFHPYKSHVPGGQVLQVELPSGKTLKSAAQDSAIGDYSK